MNARRPADQFDESSAARYRPRGGFEKTAVLVEVADPACQTVIDAPFGEQRLTGAFYAVAEGDGSYGAAKFEFEQTHTRVGANRWVKTAPVSAYQTETSCVVDTVVGDELETTVNARAGDWIVRQHTGEVMVIGPDEFADRYVREVSD
jgi:hypothetical protein